MVKITCAWCDKDMGNEDSDDNAEIKYGICDECLAEFNVIPAGEKTAVIPGKSRSKGKKPENK